MTKLIFLLALTLLLPVLGYGDCGCEADKDGERSRAIPLKIGAIFSILVAGFIGVCFPTLSKWIPAISPGRNLFFAIKAFAAGVILATGFVHILPESFDKLTSPCLSHSPWQHFPFAGFSAMMSAVCTLVLETVATSYYKRVHVGKEAADEETAAGEVHVHTHATNGHSHGDASSLSGGESVVRHRVTSQVLEVGILVHSIIIGVSLGASDAPSTIRSLFVALSFHQFFEGMGLGACIVQAQFNIKSMIAMIIFFSLTTPIGVAIGIGISSIYNENSATALIVEGIMGSGAAGILIYMALVDFLAADFMNPKIQKNGSLQIMTNIALLLGIGLMSLLAKWA